MTKEVLKEITIDAIKESNEKMRALNVKSERSAKAEKVAKLLHTNNYGCKTEVIQKLLEEVLDPEDLRDAFVMGAKWAKDTQRAPGGAADEAQARFTKYDLSYKKSGIQYVTGACVVLLGNPNGHNYPENTPIVLNPDEVGWSVKDHGLREGNRLPGSHARLATEDEIKAFVEQLDEPSLRKLAAAAAGQGVFIAESAQKEAGLVA